MIANEKKVCTQKSLKSGYKTLKSDYKKLKRVANFLNTLYCNGAPYLSSVKDWFMVHVTKKDFRT